MTDRLKRARTLPEGYQFGDAKAPPCGCATVACALHRHPKSVAGFPQWIVDSVLRRFHEHDLHAGEQ